jgi:membrane protease YdiL (CAAX protease family)
MPLHSGFLKLALLLVLTTVYGQLVAPVAGVLGSETAYYLFNKGLLAVLLVGYVLLTGQARAAGLAGGSNLRTLPIYWPLFLLMILIMLGPLTPPEPATLAALAGIAVSVGIAEELMFRGLLFHWFRDQSVRRQILISALAFGGAHLAGLLVTDAVAVILAQSVFASAVGAVIACARARDESIWLPIAVHAGFDFVAFAAAGSIGGALEDSPATVLKLLIPGILIWLWAAWLIRQAPRHELANATA